MTFEDAFVFAAAGATFTVEEAVESIGFGRFHILLFFIMGSSNVSNGRCGPGALEEPC